MGEQRTFAGIAWSQKGKVTRRERFLAEMDAVIPWAQLLALIEPHYPKAGRGRQPLGLEKMLRIYFLQQWFNLSDPQAEDAIYDSEAMRRFARVELGDDVVPDETTILRFRHLLEQHRLTAAIFEAVKELLTAKRLLLQERDDRRRDDHRRAQLDEECGAGARSRDEADAQGERVAFRDEAARRDRREGARPQPDRDACGASPTSPSCPRCCTARSACSTATRRTGRKRIGRPSRPGACGIG